jgi:hypothetical protein
VAVNWPEHEVNHLHSSCARVRHEWSYAATLFICLHGVDRDSFNPYLILGFYSLSSQTKQK